MTDEQYSKIESMLNKLPKCYKTSEIKLFFSDITLAGYKKNHNKLFWEKMINTEVSIATITGL